MRTSETITLHFDLSGHPEDREFTLLAGGGVKHVLSSYADAPGKREEHRAANAALALIGDEHIERITHFVEEAAITADHPSARRVVFASQDDHCLPEIAMLFVHIPTKDHEQHLLRSPATGDDADHVTMLGGYGVAPDAIAADHEAVRRDVQRVKSPRETAKAFVFHHPEIGSMNAIVAPEVLANWIPQADGFGDLVTYFEDNGPDSGTTWYQKSYSTWVNPKTGKEEPCPADDTRTYKDGKKPDWPVVDGTPLIPQYTLSDEATHADGGVMSAAAPVIQNVLKATKDSDKFNGQLWTSQPGTTQHLKTDVAPAPPKLAAEQALRGAAKSGFGLRNTTSSFGLTIYDDKLQFDATAKKLSFPVKNWPNRYLLAYVQFLDTAGTPIPRKDIAGWHSGLSNTW
ncbi:MAG: hypothetical protein M3R09_02025, partial [Actinomycetota bacterium]|nr:hypothetical protein [Actinomycetota bacterium]